MPSEVTLLLQCWREGDESALNALMPLIYSELHRMAQLFLRNCRPGETLQPTALVNEACLKLLDNGHAQFVDRAHFLAVMSRVMRQVLIDYARATATMKRGGQAQRVDWDTAIIVESGGSQSQLRTLEVDQALEALTAENPTLAQVIEMHYFGGMTAEEIALVADRSAHAIRHELRLARAWLRREMARES
jgi:RNA polymerase sigma-70 factor (ECF subfamily)